GSDMAWGIAVFDDSAYVTGMTNSNSFPLRNSLHLRHFDQSDPADHDGFVTRFTPDGRDLVFSTLIGGNSGSSGIGSIGVDSAGNPSITGGTNSPDFPVIHAYQRGGLGGGFVMMLSANGREILASTYLGLSAATNAVAVDNR